MKKLGIVALCALLGGCATWKQMDQGLSGLQGQSINAAISKIGYPSSEQTIAGRKLYRWGASQQSAVYMPTSSYSYGTIGTNTPYSNNTTGGAYVPVNYNCSITLEADSNDVIIGYQYNGNLGGCEPYIKALKK